MKSASAQMIKWIQREDAIGVDLRVGEWNRSFVFEIGVHIFEDRVQTAVQGEHRCESFRSINVRPSFGIAFHESLNLPPRRWLTQITATWIHKQACCGYHISCLFWFFWQVVNIPQATKFYRFSQYRPLWACIIWIERNNGSVLSIHLLHDGIASRKGLIFGWKRKRKGFFPRVQLEISIVMADAVGYPAWPEASTSNFSF